MQLTENKKLTKMPYNHKEIEPKIAQKWEEAQIFKADSKSAKKPYTIVLPPPNASGKIHIGNALMVAIEDILIRWKKMQGYETLWVPGTDHAGFETQLTFEKQLKKEGKSRFDYDRQSLYNQIWDFVQKHRGEIRSQIKSMGASLDWSREKFTLDPDVIDTVYNTFEQMATQGLIYRDNYMVNYCPVCGTTFADLEVIHKERIDPLIYVRYPLIDRTGNEPEFVTVATVRPEPIFVDTHLAVNPKDESKNWLIGRIVKNPITDAQMQIIADDFVDPEFGTGVVKMTPAHDKTDYDVAKKHGLPIISAIDINGRINAQGGELAGLKIKAAREKTIEFLKARGLIEKIDENYNHSVIVCYKNEHDIEPMVLPNWFVRVADLKKPALEAVESGKVKIYPQWREITYTQWMKEMRDWPISRQIVWGIRIPVWYSLEDNPQLQVNFIKDGQIIKGTAEELLSHHSFEDIESGLQTLIAPSNAVYKISKIKPNGSYLQETDTFDTWFSSGHWPLVSLGYPNSEDFKKFYPTAVLETGWEIIRFWVSRMIMFGIYLTGKEPFKDVYLHGLVRATDGKKMSKSLGNVLDPIELVEKYGADATRMGLINGTANGKDFAFPQDKVIAYRNFANKLWNMSKFIEMMEEKLGESAPEYSESILQKATESDKKLVADLNELKQKVNKNLEKYRFAEAGESIYHFMWDELAAKYIEETKNREDKDIAISVLKYVYLESIKLLHPFMPFITEELWGHWEPNKGLLPEQVYPQ